MQIRKKLGTAIAASGMLMIMLGVGVLPAQGAERPMPALQPSPRPAINPVRSGRGTGVQMGHVTGTVIDQRTGAPAAGVSVTVGGVTVKTDANGNYDYWVPVGSYPVALSISSDQGTPSQGSVMVDVQPNAATVQHLGFVSPAPAAPAAAQPAAPAAAAATPVPAPKPVAAVRPPQRLPRTSEGGSAPWLWIVFGMMLLMAGGVVGFAPLAGGRSARMVLQAQAANSTLLRALLAQPPVDELLAALLNAHERKSK
jgi:hypothetical protein